MKKIIYKILVRLGLIRNKEIENYSLAIDMAYQDLEDRKTYFENHINEMEEWRKKYSSDENFNYETQEYEDGK